MQANRIRHTLLALLLRAWQEEGFELGTGQALRLQELLQRLPADTPPEQLRSLLSPLLAKDEAQQRRFYALFDQSLKQAYALHDHPKAATPAPGDAAVEAAAQKVRKWRWLALAVALLTIGLLAFGIYRYFYPPERPTTERTVRATATPGDTLTVALDTLSEPLESAAPVEWQASALGYRYRVDSSGQAAYIVPDSAAAGRRDTAVARLQYAGRVDTVQLIVQLIPPVLRDTVRTAARATNNSLIAELPLPFPRDISELVLDEETEGYYAFLEQYEWPLKVLALLLLGLLAWVILRWQQYRRAKVVAELQRPDKAPYVWNPGAERSPRQWLEEAIQPLLRQFRGRAPDERQRLDVRATVRATARRAGRIAMVYRSRSLPPDYLLLIDRFAADDHRAKLFDALYQLMREAEVPVSRYFYQGDPRLCRNEAYPHGISLAELLHRHRGARLLIVGEGMGLLSPATGRLAPWVRLLEQQPHKALFSPRPRAAWGAQEREMASLLPVLPASPQGLQVALDAFLAEETPTPQEMLSQVKESLQEPVQFRGDLLQDLRAHYTTPQLDWIAACAIWPTLSWDLTLMLGEQLSEQHGQALLSFEQLRALNRLPWFAQGRMPERARRILLDYLAERGLETPMRQAIQEFLHGSVPPPPDSVAYEDYRMNLIVNELLLRPNPATRRKLEREFANYLAAGKKPDFVALRLLDRPPTRLDALVGPKLKKYAFREGLPGLGWRLAPQLLGLWLLLALPLLIWSPGYEPCAGDTVEYQGKPLCLSDAADSLLYWQYLARDAIAAQEHEQVKSLRTLADRLLPQDSAFYSNTAARYYNYGAGAFNCSLDSTEACANYSVPTDSLRALACDNFTRAARLDSMLYDTLRSPFGAARARACDIPPAETATGAPQDTLPPPATSSVPADTAATDVAVSDTTPGEAEPPSPPDEATDGEVGPLPTSDLPLPTLTKVSGGTFTMGCASAERDGDCDDDEKPAHEVTVSTFYMSMHEVTNAQFAAFLNAEGNQVEGGAEWYEIGSSYAKIKEINDGEFAVEEGFERHPVVEVSWYGARAYAAWLSEQTGQNYRLPTEAEWEYAARGGEAGATDEFLYSGSDDIDAVAWYSGNSGSRTHEVGQKQPNQLGLYDMSGNVWEWCEDDWHDGYNGAPADGRAWVDSPRASHRVSRGGGWGGYPQICRAAGRYGYRPTHRLDFVGFRLAL